MDNLVQGFGEYVGDVFCAQNMVNVDEAVVDTVAYEVRTYVDVFHLRMRMWVVSAHNSTFVVAKESCWPLREAEFDEKRA